MGQFENLHNETVWDESEFKSLIDRKFLFVFFKYENNSPILKKAKLWNMSYKDICKVKKVWEETKKVISSGNIVKKDNSNGKRSTNFPGSLFSSVAHVRPHATNSADTYPLPVNDKETGACKYTKQSFWLNNSYVRDEIYLKEASNK